MDEREVEIKRRYIGERKIWERWMREVDIERRYIGEREMIQRR